MRIAPGWSAPVGGLALWVSATLGCVQGPTPAAPAPAPEPAEPEPAAACNADAQHCCMEDGRVVQPGGCQPSYPDHVQPQVERGDDGRCVAVPCHLRCLPDTARISTPSGEVAVSALSVGQPVWTMGPSGRRIAAPVESLSSSPVEVRHVVVEVSLDDGRVLRASAGHPVAGGRVLGAVTRGDVLDGAEVVAIRTLEYAGARTWDLRPAGPTGLYWADGVLLGSTLVRRAEDLRIDR